MRKPLSPTYFVRYPILDFSFFFQKKDIVVTWILHFCISPWRNLWNSCIRAQEEGFDTLLSISSFACLEFPITQLSFFPVRKKNNIGEIFPIFHLSCGKARCFFRAFLASDRQTIWPRRQKFRALYRKNALQNRQGHILPYFSIFFKKKYVKTFGNSVHVACVSDSICSSGSGVGFAVEVSLLQPSCPAYNGRSGGSSGYS